MSTIVRNTLALGPRDTDDLMSQVQGWQEQIRMLQAATLARVASRMATDAFDSATLAGTAPGAVLGEAMQDIRRRQKAIRSDRIRDPEIDFGFEFVLLRDRASWFAMAFTERDDFAIAWRAHFGGSTFDYWNHTDRPEEVGQDEWTARAEAWDRMLGRDTPANRGFTVSSTEPDVRASIERIVAAQPDLETRARGKARDQLRGEIISVAPDMPIHDLLMKVAALDSWMGTTEGASKLAEREQEIRAVLKVRLDRNDFRG